MDWLKNLVKSLPLDAISEFIAQLVIWWSNLAKNVPDDDLPFLAYVGASILVLLLLILVVRVMPRPVGGMLWAFAVAVLLTPGDALAGTGQVAPAVVGVFHSVLMGDTAGAVSAFLPILGVFIVLLFVGAIWQILRGVIEVNIAKTKEAARIQNATAAPVITTELSNYSSKDSERRTSEHNDVSVSDHSGSDSSSGGDSGGGGGD